MARVRLDISHKLCGRFFSHDEPPLGAGRGLDGYGLCNKREKGSSSLTNDLPRTYEW